MRPKRTICLFICLITITGLGSKDIRAQDIGSREIDISGLSWKVWLDEQAEWEADTLFLPGKFHLEALPENVPTCGWDKVYDLGLDAILPVVVEELYSEGDARWTYHGVSWFTSEVDVPAFWEGQVVRLYVGKKNRRLEVYVNEELAGYDLVYAAPYSCDISAFLRPGETNRLAFRITNPGGARGWGDFPMVRWGDYLLPPAHDFGGLGAEIELQISDPVYLEDVFVQNLLPAGANHIEVELTLHNSTSLTREAWVELQILDEKEVLHTENLSLEELQPGDSVLSLHFKVPGAKQWNIAQPNLYTSKTKLISGEYADEFKRNFGFRVFEVRANEEGQENFYLNGKRFRHRSAIDWSYYAHHGFYSSGEMAEKSVRNALAIGHNGINFHRHMADEILLGTADRMGLLVLEEPGGFLEEIGFNGTGNTQSFESALMEARCLRMARRDRHHPSVAGYILTNEREKFDILRKNIMVDMHAMDPSKLIVNQSGGHPGGPSGQVPHIRPYDKKFRLDYMDDHTVSSEERFMEYEFQGHQSNKDRYTPNKYGRIDPLAHDNIIYWGEVRCYTGPDNWFNIDQQAEKLPGGRKGYNYKNSEILAKKTAEYFKQNQFPDAVEPLLQSPVDLSVQAGRGLMYSNGRLGQIIMSNDSEDGYAINGWSGGSSVLSPGHGANLEWYSAMVDEGRNLKGPAGDLAWWIRPLQVAIFRMNGKYFEPGDTMRLKVDLINEGMLEAGTYDFQIVVRDGAGRLTSYSKKGILEVKGGDCFAQSIEKELEIPISSSWHGGYLTIEGSLGQEDRVLADGFEQALLMNRSSYGEELGKYDIKVHDWPEAEKALSEANYSSPDPSGGALSVVFLAGEFQSASLLRSVLKEVKKGASLIIRFDSIWADQLYEQKILSSPVTEWGGHQIGHWKGNGWGFISALTGSLSMPGKGTIGTNSWEVPGDPSGFFPFESSHPQTSYGAWFARPDTLLTLFGEISYGKGRILLTPSYPVDGGNAFSDLLFFNMILGF